MDIYEYFNSRDIADHCKKLGHNFTGRELAYMIWQSNHHTLEQKIAAWEELIGTAPNEPLENGDNLHRFLRHYIARLQQFISDFQADTKSCVYSCEQLSSHISNHYINESVLYENYHTCMAAALTKVDKDVLSIRIQKKKIHNQSSDQMGSAMLYLTINGEPMDVVVAPYYGEIDLLVAPFGFHGWYVKIPTPFKSGDLVTSMDCYGPMVVDKLPDDQGEDYLDMCAHLWELDKQHRLIHNQYVSYLSLEYYRGHLVGQERFLYALHNYIQNKLPLSDLLRSYMVMVLAFLSTRQADFGAGTEDVLHLTGLDADVVHIE